MPTTQLAIHASPVAHHRRRPNVILLNGLAEQEATWFRNMAFWGRHFEVHAPTLAAYDGEAVQSRIERREPIDVDFLIERLHRFLGEFVQAPPYHLVANSMGGKLAVEFALRHPELVDRLVLICPSGLSETESLPIIDGVRRSDIRAVVESIFEDASCVMPEIIDHYRRRVQDKRWRSGLLRTIRGTMPHNVRGRVSRLTCPTLFIIGEEDRIVRPTDSIAAARTVPGSRLIRIPDCGHAPQIERAELVNQWVLQFLEGDEPPSRQWDGTSQRLANGPANAEGQHA